MHIQLDATPANFRDKATRCRLLAANTGDEDFANELATLADQYDQAALDLDVST